MNNDYQRNIMYTIFIRLVLKRSNISKVSLSYSLNVGIVPVLIYDKGLKIQFIQFSV